MRGGRRVEWRWAGLRAVLAGGVGMLVVGLALVVGGPPTGALAPAGSGKPAAPGPAGRPPPDITYLLNQTVTPAALVDASTFDSTVTPVTRAQVRYSWREGCPVHYRDLRLIRADHWGFDGREHTGAIVVHRTLTADVVATLERLFADRFPIARMQLVDVYHADDDASMAANNTSAFNCRPVAGTDSWSEHSYGRAIDLNPVQNPYVSSGGSVAPPAGAPYADRSRQHPGMVHAGDATVQAFATIGWEWGGTWQSAKDYQHFSSTGR